MKRRLLLWVGVISTLSLYSNDKDTTYWKNNLKTGINFNQTSFSDNWKGGGDRSIAVSGLLLGKASYNKDKTDWVTQMDFQYGRVRSGDQKQSRKSQDKMMIDTKIGYRLNSDWNAFSSLSFLSQFDNGLEYVDTLSTPLKKSGFLAPAYITSTWGVEYKPGDAFYVRISPFSPRITIVNDTSLYRNIPENYGVKPGEKIRYEWKAFKMTANYEKEIVENISIKADYELFGNVEDFTFDKIDHRLDLILTAKIYKFLNLTILSNFIKDLDQVVLEDRVDNGVLTEKEKKWQSSIQIGLSFLFSYSNIPPAPPK